MRGGWITIERELLNMEMTAGLMRAFSESGTDRLACNALVADTQCATTGEHLFVPSLYLVIALRSALLALSVHGRNVVIVAWKQNSSLEFYVPDEAPHSCSVPLGLAESSTVQ